MTILNNDPLTQLAFSISENKGVFAILIGSGLSRAADIPTGWEITIDLIRRIAISQGVPDQNDWGKWYREKFSKEPNYSELLEEVASTKEERRSILHGYIEANSNDIEEGKKVPTLAHHVIAKLVGSGHIKVIITTNFDRLMENALRENGIEPTVVFSEDSLNGAEPITHSKCYLLKIHGDYKDARILNTDAELDSYPEGYNKLLDRIFDEHGLLICGWSGEWDHALQAAILRSPNRRYPTFWLARGKLGDSASRLVSHRDGKVIPIASADEFFTSLSERLDAVESSRKQNPQSVDLLITNTKRYLSKPDYRIQLDDLFFDVLSRLLAGLDSHEFSAQSQFGPKEFRLRIEQYESYSEAIVKMAGILGRWGDDTELNIVVDTLRSIYIHAEKVRAGISVWLNLRSYPAVLIFTAYGVSLTKSKRWGALHAFFNSTISIDGREPKKLVDCLFLDTWSGGSNDLWNNLQGFDRRKTALDDHLLDVMTIWKDSFIGIESNFELLYERFETLASLVYFEDNDLAELENAVSPNPREYLAWMPVGRVGWDSANQKIILQELESQSTLITLLEARFANGIQRLYELFINNLSRFGNIMRW